MEKETWMDIEQLLKEGQTLQLKPQGWSMYPLFVPGRDEARIAPISEKRRLRRGDVVLYRREKSILVLHRIARINDRGIFLVGDNQAEVEGPLSTTQMRGVMIGFVRKGVYHTTSNVFYQIYARIWLCLRPVRPVIAKLVARCKRRKMQK